MAPLTCKLRNSSRNDLCAPQFLDHASARRRFRNRVSSSRTKYLRSTGDLRTESDRPAAHGLVADADPALSQQLFDVKESRAMGVSCNRNPAIPETTAH